MTDTNDLPEPAVSQESIVVIPSSLIHYARERKLSGLQYELWLFLYEIDPFGNRWVEVPSPAEIAIELGCDPRSIQRAAQRLQDCDLFDFQIKSWKARNTTVTTRSLENSTGKEIHLRTKRSNRGQFDPIADKRIQLSKNGSKDPIVQSDRALKPAQRKDSENGQCTNNGSNRSNKQTVGTSTQADSLRSIDSEGIGTEAKTPQTVDTAVIEQITNTGVRINKTVETALAEARQTYGSAAATVRAIENALSSLAEQRKKGTVRNPGGFFVAALRRGFTSNGAKRQARERGEAIKAPDLSTVEMQIDHYLISEQRRDWALAKLQELYEKWEEPITHLLSVRKDWGFLASAEGVKDENR
jgi:hypothetical protein